MVITNIKEHLQKQEEALSDSSSDFKLIYVEC